MSLTDFGKRVSLTAFRPPSIELTSRAVAAPIFVGAATLALGAVYYFSVRPMAISAGFASIDAQGLPVLALALGSLPTFLHVLAFSLLTGALNGMPASSRAWNCAVWAGVNAVFEIGQHETVARVLVVQLYSWCGTTIACARTSQYFAHGTFDIADLIAGSLGGLLAYTILNNSARHAESVS